MFADGFNHATVEEDGAIVVVLAELAVLVEYHVFLFGEEVIVIDEVDLHSGFLDRGDLDDQGVVGVVDDEVHSRQADHFVKLVAPFVDDTVSRHENPDFLALFLNGLG